MELHIDTPLVAARADYSAAGRPLLFKMDALQPSGSFKLRGIGRLCAHEVAQGATAIVCASGGNAGFAAAYAGVKLGAPVIIVVPSTTSPEVRDAIAATGAQVEVHGDVFDEAGAYAVALAGRTGGTYVHPFDHPLLWDGHATLIDEVVAAGAAFDCVVTAVGGGGLLAGIVAGLKRNGLGHVPVIAVETEGAATLYRSVEAGEIVTLPAITSIATSMGARRVADHVFGLTREHEIIPVLVSDAQAVQGCLKFADAQRVLVEPACGAALAALDVHANVFERFERPLVEVCGGIGVSLTRLAGWKAQFGV